MMSSRTNTYDVIIISASIAGLSAVLRITRQGLKALIVGEDIGVDHYQRMRSRITWLHEH
ncbi:hypothetical protein [Vulcanisaeta sp. JCM 16161]|uniref:hypothetical protein n=1 Tax=Vulcanisaeta sp. JCM 16161 TaxID=1295372 RepID=UPI00406BE8E0